MSTTNRHRKDFSANKADLLNESAAIKNELLEKHKIFHADVAKQNQEAMQIMNDKFGAHIRKINKECQEEHPIIAELRIDKCVRDHYYDIEAYTNAHERLELYAHIKTKMEWEKKIENDPYPHSRPNRILEIRKEHHRELAKDHKSDPIHLAHEMEHDQLVSSYLNNEKNSIDFTKEYEQMNNRHIRESIPTHERQFEMVGKPIEPHIIDDN